MKKLVFRTLLFVIANGCRGLGIRKSCHGIGDKSSYSMD